MYRTARYLGFLALVLAVAMPALAAETATPSKVLIINARVFDGEHEALAMGMSVLVEGNKIARIAKSIAPPAGASVIDAKGRVLMPGLIDAHWHTIFNFWPISKAVSSDFGLLSIAAAKAAGQTLLRASPRYGMSGETPSRYRGRPMTP